MMRLANIIRRWRGAADLTHKEVSDEIGIHHTSLARFERGEKPTSDTLIKLWVWVMGDEEDASDSSAPGADRGANATDQKSSDSPVA